MGSQEASAVRRSISTTDEGCDGGQGQDRRTNAGSLFGRQVQLAGGREVNETANCLAVLFDEVIDHDE